ncbi:hypothetical protein BDQ17DRAFT_1364414, partial [Cyathus striatus]
MMRNTMPLSRPPAVSISSPKDTPVHTQAIPSIRLISATPSATGLSASEASNTSFPRPSSLPYQFHNDTFDSSWASMSSADGGARKKLVPKKSKLGLLSSERGAKDLSDVARRVGATGSTARGGFEIYVDPTEDPEMGDIVMVKKKKSRAALDGLAWGGGGALGEVTNVPKLNEEEG